MPESPRHGSGEFPDQLSRLVADAIQKVRLVNLEERSDNKVVARLVNLEIERIAG